MKPKFSTASLKEYKGEKVTGEFILGALTYGQSAKADWQNVILKDKAGSIECKIWKQNTSAAYEQLVGHPVIAVGNVTERNGKAEFTVEKLELCTDPDIKNLIETESDAVIGKAVEFLRKTFDGLKNEQLKKAVESYLDDRLVADMSMFADSRFYKVGGFWTELGAMVAMLKKLGTMASFAYKADIAYAAVFFYCYGAITYQAIGELTAARAKNGEYSTLWYEACKIVERCLMDESITAELTHCVRAIGKAENPKTAEAYIASFAVETYYKISERRMNGWV